MINVLSNSIIIMYCQIFSYSSEFKKSILMFHVSQVPLDL